MPTFFDTPVQTLVMLLKDAIRFRVLRDGLVTPGVKYVRVCRVFNTTGQGDIAQEALGGEFTPYVNVLRQELVDQPGWVVYAEDTTPPAKVHAQYLAIPGAGTYTLNILTGTGSEVTEPATVDALVRLDGMPAERDVLVVERKLDGEWRVAGSGTSAADGTVTVDLDVVDGSLYALGLDDFGIPFSPGLTVEVGRRIRPSVFTGVLYQITEPGALPAAEPTWWPITSEGSRELGTARAEAVRYYRPLAHGPVTAEPS
ncbi:Uncharacterised protein [Aquipseudomonas alcaligenes]|uniref:Uncharacterized protein n=1 Tax=Aquipseudomonas alcaligenes (strain ATCC 14909 / DSM 50342 / CCUG 1425 / JCM 20561 / NBRC 14159 / NCIMB 9945 / NCTC 10367 / 1577) TaxID=1215092 RepID=U2ZMC8_AQUA1|nr:hypothetical protein PA6_014_00130 [Pseudomonas alcaligenes NBRC 14159]SUD18175.1 Uncharacterised protein [Pseudomonas alcaligenes]